MRDGATIYADIFLPVGTEVVPAILAWSPYGKTLPQPAPPGVGREAGADVLEGAGPDVETGLE